jgi:hypothetical protein
LGAHQHQRYTENAGNKKTNLYHNLSSHFFVIETLHALSELDSTNTATIFYMHQLKLLISNSKVSTVVFA